MKHIDFQGGVVDLCHESSLAPSTAIIKIKYGERKAKGITRLKYQINIFKIPKGLETQNSEKN